MIVYAIGKNKISYCGLVYCGLGFNLSDGVDKPNNIARRTFTSKVCGVSALETGI
jgi:hypothetical protein